MKKIFTKIIAWTFVFSVLLSTFVNAYDIEQSVLNLLDGWYVPCNLDKNNQMYFKANYIKHMKKHVNTILLGSSYLLSVSSEDAGSDFVNLSVGGSTFEDRINILGLLDYYGITYDRVIFEIDLASLNYKRQKIDGVFGYFGNRFLNILDGKPNEAKEEIDFNKSYTEKPVFEMLNKYTIVDRPKDSFVYSKDLSIIYPNVIYVAKMQNTEDTKNFFYINDKKYFGMSISDDYKKIVDDILNYFKSNNIKGNVIVVPRPNYVYDDLNLGTCPLFAEFEKFSRDMAYNHMFKFSGSLNPHLFGWTDDDFYDDFHPYPTSLSKGFDFKGY